jgi:hypothetical protein
MTGVPSGFDELKGALAGVEEKTGATAAAAADEEVGALVAVKVKPRDARTGLAEAMGQEGLALEIVEG